MAKIIMCRDVMSFQISETHRQDMEQMVGPVYQQAEKPHSYREINDTLIRVASNFEVELSQQSTSVEKLEGLALKSCYQPLSNCCELTSTVTTTPRSLVRRKG